MSNSTLHHVFEKIIGQSPTQNSKKIRLHQSRLMIVSNGLSDSEAAYKVATITNHNSAGNLGDSSDRLQAGQLKSYNINSAHNEIFSENNFRPSNNHDDDRHLWGSIWQNECGQTQSSQNCWRLE